MSLLIRPIAAQDRADWARLFTDYATFYETQIPTGGLDTVWNWLRDDDRPFWAAVALVDHRPVGFTHYHRFTSPLKAGTEIYLNDLYVDPNQRGQDAGFHLIRHVIDHARQMGDLGVRWATAEDNATARRLYDRITEGPSGFIMYKAGL